MERVSCEISTILVYRSSDFTLVSLLDAFRELAIAIDDKNLTGFFLDEKQSPKIPLLSRLSLIRVSRDFPRRFISGIVNTDARCFPARLIFHFIRSNVIRSIPDLNKSSAETWKVHYLFAIGRKYRTRNAANRFCTRAP